jgi:hypothetical protein
MLTRTCSNKSNNKREIALRIDSNGFELELQSGVESVNRSSLVNQIGLLLVNVPREYSSLAANVTLR